MTLIFRYNNIVRVMIMIMIIVSVDKMINTVVEEVL